MSAPVLDASRVRPPGRPRLARRPSERSPEDLLLLVASAVSAVSLCWLLFARLTDGVGWFAFLVCSFGTFIAIYYFVLLDRYGSLVAADRAMSAIVVVGACVLLVPLTWLIGYVVVKGVPTLRAAFFVHDQRGVTPILPATAGGGAHAIIGTVEQVGLALLWSLPLGLLTAVFLNESRSRWRRPVRIFVDAMSGLPSVVAGLFIFAVLILPFAKQSTLFSFNGFMASLALAMIMLPTITQTVTVVLRLVPDGLREASQALGASRARTVWSVVLPTARTGITTGVVLGIARAVGETAPLLFTAFGYDLMNANPFSGAQESLPLFVYRNIRKPDVHAISRGFVGAFVLMLIVLGLFLLARWIGRDRSVVSSRRQLWLRIRRTKTEVQA
ncbi:MAG: phosphate ABC transporter permease PstA [Actinomycetota bacterium]|nr:phosphate ABC transporter permease PstA [Actinomycetota bacterium]